MKRILLLFLFSVALQAISAQSFPGFSGDNYNGAMGLTTNPANIADSRLKMDINLFSFNILGSTDYLPLTFGNFKGFIDDFSFDDSTKRHSSNTNEILANVDILGPSFMYTIDEVSGIGFYTRVRRVYNYNNINGKLFEGSLGNFPSENFDYDILNLDTSVHMWGELGFSYARVLLNEGNHFFKAGATLKFLLGAGTSQSQSSSLNGNFNTANASLSVTGDFSYISTFGNESPNFSLSDLTPGFSWDIGFVYEYRPDEARSMAAYLGHRETNKYKFKIGVSLLDYGELIYKDVNRASYTGLNGSIATSEFETKNLSQVLSDNFEANEFTRDGNLTIALPTSLQFNLDYKAFRDIYFNLEYNQTMVKKEKAYNNNRINHLTITPRFEKKHMAAYLPITISPLGGTAVGAGFRLGPVTIGSGSILSNLVLKKPKNLNVFAALRLTTHHVGRRR